MESAGSNYGSVEEKKNTPKNMVGDENMDLKL